MGYMHIDNLYKATDVLLFKEVYVLEKIHGTSAHISWKLPEPGAGLIEQIVDGAGKLTFSSGGETHDKFVRLFDQEKLREGLLKVGQDVVIFGEAYGGKQQRMGETYGKQLKFIVFDVKIGESWLTVPKMAKFAEDLGLEVVAWTLVPSDQAVLDQYRDADSVQAIRNGCGEGKLREGIVVRPPIEVKDNRGNRLMAKHKREEFKETATPRPVIGDPAKLAVLDAAKAIAEEWVTPMRLDHVLDKVVVTGTAAITRNELGMEQMGIIIKAMIEDVFREGKGEIVESKDAERAIGARTAMLFKKRLQLQLGAAAPQTKVDNESQAETGPAATSPNPMTDWMKDCPERS